MSKKTVGRTVRRLCPVCGAPRPRFLYRQAFSEISAASLMSGYDVVVCRGCGFAFADDIPLQSEFDRHYRGMSKYEYAERPSADAEYDLQRFSSLAASVSAYLPSSSARILDVGCSTGALLGMFRKKGFRDVTGLDPSPACRAAARRDHGIRVLTGPISRMSEILSGELPFDCALLSGVLEHIRDMDRTMDSIRGLLAPGGLAAIEVPDATHFARHPDAPFQQFSTEHINFFSPRSLTNFLRGRGFVRVSCRRNERVQTFGTIMPVVTAVFRKTARGSPGRMVRDRETAKELEKYIRGSRAVERRIVRLIGSLSKSRRPVIVWGAGTHTLRLLASGGLSKVNIRAFVDSSPHYQGRKLAGLPIKPPSWLLSRREPVLISSRVFQASIENQVRSKLRLRNGLIKLYSL